MRRARNWHLVAVLNYLIVVWLLWIVYGTDQPEKKKPKRNIRISWSGWWNDKKNRLGWVRIGWGLDFDWLLGASTLELIALHIFKVPSISHIKPWS